MEVKVIYTGDKQKSVEENCTHKSLFSDINVAGFCVHTTAVNHLFSLSKDTGSTLLSICPSLCLSGVDTFHFIWKRHITSVNFDH